MDYDGLTVRCHAVYIEELLSSSLVWLVLAARMWTEPIIPGGPEPKRSRFAAAFRAYHVSAKGLANPPLGRFMTPERMRNGNPKSPPSGLGFPG